MEQREENTDMTNDRMIKELIALLNRNQWKEAANHVFEMAAYIDVMEQKMDAVMEELVQVRKQLAEIENRQERKVIREALSDAVEKLEQQCRKMKQQLFEVKTEIKTKAAEIVTAVKEKGKAALDKVSEFLGIREKLHNIRRNVQESIAEVDKSIQKIDAFGIGIRETGHKLANTFRTFADKPEKEYGEKRFSKTELVKKPFQAKRKLLSDILNYTDSAIEKAEKLASDVRQQRMDKRKHERKDPEEEKVISLAANIKVAEPEYQYGAEVFETYQQIVKAEPVVASGTEVIEVKSKNR